MLRRHRMAAILTLAVHVLPPGVGADGISEPRRVCQWGLDGPPLGRPAPGVGLSPPRHADHTCGDAIARFLPHEPLDRLGMPRAIAHRELPLDLIGRLCVVEVQVPALRADAATEDQRALPRSTLGDVIT